MRAASACTATLSCVASALAATAQGMRESTAQMGAIVACCATAVLAYAGCSRGAATRIIEAITDTMLLLMSFSVSTPIVHCGCRRGDPKQGSLRKLAEQGSCKACGSHCARSPGKVRGLSPPLKACVAGRTAAPSVSTMHGHAIAALFVPISSVLQTRGPVRFGQMLHFDGTYLPPRT
jgi:hypothetical protein